MRTSLSIVIPLFNEEENVARLLQAIYESCNAFDYELIVVDDGSSDSTSAQVRQFKKDNTKLLTLAKNYGQSAAIKAGIDISVNKLIAVMDGDLQNDPRDILRLVQQLRDNNLDLVQGYRKNRHDSYAKKIPSLVANQLIRYLFNFPLHDIGCAIKVFKKSSLSTVHYFNGFHRYLALILYLSGKKIGELEVIHNSRLYGKSKYGIKRTIRVIQHLWLFKINSIHKLPVLEYVFLR